ncbi:hypothetical protein V8J36_05285 [Frigidibacter sp. MR17.14]|uniref:hypothetical protein n=1 Tax=Frigidibacter sp. MR17.14 TaxID=3126509 RepID=UPI003012CF8B
MSITYPLEMPDLRSLASITIRSVNVVALSSSQFTLAHQVHAWPGQRWEADIELPRLTRVDAQQWAAWMTSLRGMVGTFLLGDPAIIKRGTATSAVVSGVSGTGELSVAMSGSLLAGDHIQIGAGAGARLHQVLADQGGDGTLQVWPYLRRTVEGEALILTSPKGVFRLSSNLVEWTMRPANLSAGRSFSAMEVI